MGAESLANVIISLFLPLVISYLKSVTWKRWQKELLAFGLAAGVGIVTAVATGDPQAHLSDHILTALIISQLSYRLILERMALEKILREKRIK